jgi:acyl transferase domain-containing protein
MDHEQHQHAASSIAIVAMDGRFPGADGVEAFWDNLRRGHAGLRNLDIAASAGTVNRLGVINRPEWFDPGFFSLGTRDGLLLDPQHRLFFECCHHALDTAGCLREGVDQRVGVAATASHSGYAEHLRAHLAAEGGAPPAMVDLYNHADFLATFAAYLFDLRGPAMTVQCGCSSSLVAVHLACQSLLNFESDVMLAGGTCVVNVDAGGYVYEPGGIFASDGHCRAFDARANGTVPGDGVAVVALKRLDDALEAGDVIHAVILASAVNNDGRIKASFFAPSAAGQQRVIRDALDFAGLSPAQVGYVEAHGTGTSIGDPIEFAALRQVFDDGVARAHRCHLGAVKSAIGHTDVTAGVIGLIKAALVVRDGVIPPQLDYAEPHPELRIEASPFQISTAAADWPASQQPRIAGVTALGIGGTNAHVLVAQPPRRSTLAAAPTSRGRVVLPLTAHHRDALTERIEQLATACEDGLDPADASFTLGTVAQLHAARAALVVDPASRRVARVAQRDEPVPTAGGRDIVFAFPGQGSGYRGCAADWYRGEPAFRAHFDECWRLVLTHGGPDLLPLLVDADAGGPPVRPDTAVDQPALFALEYSMARTLMDWGMTPQFMIGHSLGELVCACLASVLPLESAVRLVLVRASAMAEQQSGAMLAVPMNEQEAVEWAERHGLDLAAVNGPASCVLSGAAAGIEAAERALIEAQRRCIRLATSHAFHSRLMEPACRRLRETTVGLSCRAPAIPYASNVTGTLFDRRSAPDAAYWSLHVRMPVRFAAGMASLLAHARDPLVVEIGPGSTLINLVRALRPHGAPVDCVSTMPAPAGPGDVQDAASALARLWVAGAPVDWNAYHAIESRRHVELPRYPYCRVRLWPDASAAEPPREPVPARAAVTADAPDVLREILDVATRMLGGTPQAGDNFFALGGNSLLAVHFAAVLSRQLGLELLPADIMACGTLGEIPHRVRAGSAPVSLLCAPSERGAGVLQALSPAQEWMWRWQQRAVGTALFNVPYGLVFTHERPAHDVAQLITATLHRFDSLRLRFRGSDRSARQYVDAAPVALPLTDMRDCSESAQDFDDRARECFAALAAEPFHLDGDAPVRARLLYREDRFALLLVVHHIAIDGWSLSIVADVLMRALATGTPGGARASFLALAARQSERTAAPSAEYWRRYLAGLPPNPERPGDLTRPPKFTCRGATVKARLSGEETRRLRAIAARERLSPFHLLLAAFAFELARCCEGCAEEAWIRSPVANRDDTSMDAVGFCLSTIVVRVPQPARDAFLVLARRVAEATMTAMAHCGAAPLDIVDAAGPPAHDGHFSRFPYEFNHLEYAPEEQASRDGRFGELEVPASDAIKADLSLTTTMAGERIEISLSYYTDAVTASFAQRFMDGYVATLKVHDEQPYERQI